MKRLNNNIVKALNDFQWIVYDNNEEAGWHSDMITGEPYTEEQQDAMFPVRIALCHSELSEALEGWRKNRLDDHLPNRRNDVVELADAVIRIFDLAASKRYNLPAAIAEKLAYNISRSDHKLESRQKPNGKRI